MRRKMLAVVLSASALAMTAAPATAAITVGPGKGNPQTNPTGKCPSGQYDSVLRRSSSVPGEGSPLAQRSPAQCFD